MGVERRWLQSHEATSFINCYGNQNENRLSFHTSKQLGRYASLNHNIYILTDLIPVYADHPAHACQSGADPWWRGGRGHASTYICQIIFKVEKKGPSICLNIFKNIPRIPPPHLLTRVHTARAWPYRVL